MGGGTLWKNVARAVGAAAPTVALTPTAAHCSACTATPTASARAGGASCNCKTAGAVQVQPGLTPVSYGPRQFWDLEDWEFAGDEERDRYVFGSLPTVEEVEDASSELQNALSLGLFTPPVPRSETLPKPEPSSPRSLDILEVTEVSTVTTVGMKEEDVTSDLSAHSIEPDLWLEPPPYGMTTVSDEPKAWKEPPSCEATTIFEEPKAWMEPPSYEVVTSPKAEEAPSRAMLEAFHQFQHNPAVQGMVVSLAKDKGVWDAVLANEKIKEFRRDFNAPKTAGMPSGGVSMVQKVESSSKHTNIFTQIFWKSKKAFLYFIQGFRNFVASLFETVEKNSHGSGGNEKVNFLERSLRACMMLAVLVLTIVVFKRSISAKRG
ncbi:uncharacterized protein [Physcomitrium patens]|uniref:Uncharacterized protein n=1 Tax=Physcomitrium patens TaxID=3218 RepID=A0A2K1KZQ6_PHYPA|nr:uncharacterized protein LOC112278958 [Physcomitrium patens]PNR59230.1 hypothetical protein PHYPA_002021 [Physcomitrium patens]|eukprot:XP_024368679.1 uncharacterized protein LOC112278958 [Physcomitrella patens]